jgi:hypothetical protein
MNALVRTFASALLVAALCFGLAFLLTRSATVRSPETSIFSGLTEDTEAVATLDRAHGATDRWNEISGVGALWYDGEAETEMQFSVADDGSFVVVSDWSTQARIGQGATARIDHERKEATVTVASPAASARQPIPADPRPTTVDLIDNAIAPGVLLEDVVATRGESAALTSASAQRIGGRSTDRMQVSFAGEHDDAFPNGWRLWVDQDTGVLMRTEMSLGESDGTARTRNFELRDVRFKRNANLERVVIPAGYTVNLVTIGDDGAVVEHAPRVAETDELFSSVVAAA